ncbi:DUF6879 family protein [Actinokineospora sp. NPDC004072]
MRELLGAGGGQRLLGAAYWSRFEADFWRIGASGFWKLERLQTFREPGDPSWRAFADGRWDHALALLEQRRAELAEHYAKMAAKGFQTWRIRVVEHPLTDYLLWEMHLLRLRDELGGHTRVLDAREVADHERHSILPEVIVLGDHVVYELLYDETGLQEGGIRHTGSAVAARCREFIRALYGKGEEISRFFAREIAAAAPGTA